MCERIVLPCILYHLFSENKSPNCYFHREIFMFSSKKRYSRTDLACESVEGVSDVSGTESRVYESFGFEVSLTRINTSEAAKRIGKPCGAYYSVFTGKTRILSDDQRAELVSLTAELLRECIKNVTGKGDMSALTVLVAGIGNRNLTADAVGPFSVDGLTVTRALKYSNRELFSRLKCADVSAIAPGVSAETGIEAADIILHAAHTVGADVIILIDALAARSCSRLASTLQISDTGINPGSGIGNSRSAIDRETMQIPVVTVGVPTVVDSATLVYEALAESGAELGLCGEKLDRLLSTGKSFFVSPQDADVTVRDISSIISQAVDLLCGTR